LIEVLRDFASRCGISLTIAPDVHQRIESRRRTWTTEEARVRPLLLAAIAVFTVALSAQESFSPAQHQTGTASPLPAMAVGGGQVLLQLTVGANGRVTEVKPLRTTPPFTEMLTQAVREWRFRPAENGDSSNRAGDTRSGSRGAVESKVLVAGFFRPPALNMPTLGEAPTEGASASDEIAFPLTMVPPAFSPLAIRGGVVLLEARVGVGGTAADIKVLQSAAPFDEAARSALSDWIFRPARIHGSYAPTFVYVVLGFAPNSVGAPSAALQ
jgi:outer membrane biosynthesis protein TonB